MKTMALIALVAISLAACGPNSSPEGRMSIKMDQLKASFDSLKAQNKALADSLHQIRLEIADSKMGKIYR